MAGTAGENVKKDAGTPLNLENHLKDINGALKEITGKPTGGSEFLLGMAVAAAPVSPVASFILGVASAIAGDYGESKFLDEDLSKFAKAQAKNKVAPKDLLSSPKRKTQPGVPFVEKVNTTRASVKSPIKGAKMKEAADLMKKRDHTLLLLKGVNRFENNANRMADEYKKGSQFVKELAAKRPEVAKALNIKAKNPGTGMKV